VRNVTHFELKGASLVSAESRTILATRQKRYPVQTNLVGGYEIASKIARGTVASIGTSPAAVVNVVHAPPMTLIKQPSSFVERPKALLEAWNQTSRKEGLQVTSPITTTVT
jgi:hypothetical protein